MGRKFRRSFGALDEVFEFADSFFAENEVGERSAFALKLAIEEVFTNFVKYNPDSGAKIAVDLEQRRGHIVVTLIDPDTAPFDITEYDVADTTSPLEDRDPGGLGIYLVRKMMDDVQFEHSDRKSTIILTKKVNS